VNPPGFIARRSSDGELLVDTYGNAILFHDRADVDRCLTATPGTAGFAAVPLARWLGTRRRPQPPPDVPAADQPGTG
jgi:hypothetical protein